MNNRSLHWYDPITINIYWLGLSSITDTMTPLVVPLLVQQFVGEEAKGSAYGNIRLWSLMIALLTQSIIGMISDHSAFTMGKRKPFMILGGLADLIIMAAIGFSTGLQGTTGYWVLFLLVVLLAVASNTAQAGLQGLIPDLVPDTLRGRFSGIKAIFEIPLPLVLIAFLVAKKIASGDMWTGILIAMGIVVITLIFSLLVREPKPEMPAARLDWKPLFRLGGMTGIFTALIIGMGECVRWISGLVVQIESQKIFLMMMGTVAFAGLVIAIGAGVWISLFTGLGKEGRMKPAFTWWIVNRLAFLVGATNLGSFTIYFLQARLGYIHEKAAGPAAVLTTFVGIFIIVSALPGGWLADKFGPKRLVVTSGFVAFVGTMVAILAPTLPVIYIGGCIIGAAVGLFYTSNWALGTSLVPHAQAGRYLGISNLAGAGAGAIGAYIGGPITDVISRQIPQNPGIGYVLLFAIYGILFLLSAAAIAGIKEDKPKEEAPAGSVNSLSVPS